MLHHRLSWQALSKCGPSSMQFIEGRELVGAVLVISSSTSSVRAIQAEPKRNLPLLLHFFVSSHQFPLVDDVGFHCVFQVRPVTYLGITQFYVEGVQVKEIAVLAVGWARSNITRFPR